jgi:hypothetical protein
VVFHGLRNYDSHLLLSALAKMNLTDRINVIPHNMEQFISFSVRVDILKQKTDVVCDADKFADMSLVFLDSFAFMNRSLSELATNMRHDDYNIMRSEIADSHNHGEAWCPLLAIPSPDHAFTALMRKGVYPYDHMTDFSVFEERQLPSRQQFHSQLYDSDISEEDYVHAQHVWTLFKACNMGDYHDIYLATDVLILADLFENFRSACQDAYDLDAAHYLTTASLSWDACLKMTRVKLDVISDPNMHLFFEAGIRGGLSQISHRFAKANNTKAALNETDIDLSKPSTFIVYLDMNNLYGTAMIKPLPYQKLKWFRKETTTDDIGKLLDSYSDSDERGFICEVDLEYPSDLHDAHNDFPLAPETREPPEISPMTERLSRFAMGGKLPPTAHKNPKLLAHFLPRRNYVVHAAALKFYLQMGMKLTKFHRGVRFRQKAWIKPYIELNTRLRQEATSAFRKDFFKLMNNRFVAFGSLN